jgi:hypothetical protein
VVRNLADELQEARDQSVEMHRHCAILDDELAMLKESLEDRCSQLEQANTSFNVQAQSLEEAREVLASNVPVPQAAWLATEVHVSHRTQLHDSCLNATAETPLVTEKSVVIKGKCHNWIT